jgi:hypothetical protein
MLLVAENANTDLPPVGFCIHLLLGSKYDGSALEFFVLSLQGSSIMNFVPFPNPQIRDIEVVPSSFHILRENWN